MSKTYTDLSRKVIQMFLKKGFKPLGYGCNKATFVHGNYIYKIAKSIHAIKDIIVEDMLYRQSEKGMFTFNSEHNGPVLIQLAKCRLFFIDKFPILIMEKVIPLEANEARLLDRDIEHEWMRYVGDGRQVGKARSGDYKSFDFGGSYHLSFGIEECALDFCKEITEDMGLKKNRDGWSEGEYIGSSYLDDIGMELSQGSPSRSFIESKKNILEFS